MVDDARRRLAAVADAVAGRPRPGVVVVEWTDPPYAAGHWVPELAAIAGGRELLGATAEPSFRTTWDRIRDLAPEVVVIAPCGYDLARTRAEATPERVAGWLAGTPALRDGRVWAIDANAYLSRPGPRIVEGAELLAAHPASGDRGDGAGGRLARSPPEAEAVGRRQQPAHERRPGSRWQHHAVQRPAPARQAHRAQRGDTRAGRRSGAPAPGPSPTATAARGSRRRSPGTRAGCAR